MNNKTKTSLCLIGFIISLLVVLLLGYYELYTYTLFVLLISFIILVVLILFIASNGKDEYGKFTSKFKKILKTYDAILTSTENIPDFAGKNVIIIDNFDDLVDAQCEIRKPICYKKRFDSCSFILLDEREVYIYILRVRPDTISELDGIIKNNKNNLNKSDDSFILDDIEKTTIIKVKNKTFKISPIKEKK